MSSSPSDLAANATEAAMALYLKFKSVPEKTQLSLVPELQQAGEDGLTALMLFLAERPIAPSQSTSADLVAGAAYQTLFGANSIAATEFLSSQFPAGIVPLRSDAGIDYAPLQELLAKQDFLSADKLTLQLLCELAGVGQRKWIYFTEVGRLPIVDLRTINALWLVHSAGQFGFSVQREVWLSVGKDWEKLWSKIGWKTGNTWTRYPQEFTWDLTAPRGHLPLSNQLRGVRVIASLLAHPAWVN